MERSSLPDDVKGECPICGARDGGCSPIMATARTPMVLTLAEQAERSKGMSSIVVQDRVYLDAQGKATTDETKGVSLWRVPGMIVPEEEAKAVGYRLPATKAVAKPKGAKVVEGPGGNK